MLAKQRIKKSKSRMSIQSYQLVNISTNERVFVNVSIPRFVWLAPLITPVVKQSTSKASVMRRKLVGSSKPLFDFSSRSRRGLTFTNPALNTTLFSTEKKVRKQKGGEA